MAGKPIGAAGADFAQRLGKLASAVERGSRDTATDMGMAAKTVHLAILKADSGGDLRLSGVGRRRGRQGNRKIGARFDVERRGDTVRTKVKATGPVHIIAHPMSSHVIRSAYAKRGGSTRAVLKIPGIGFRRSARHPGTSGKDSWNRGKRRARPRVAKVAEAKTSNVIRRGFS